jgi:single-stranded-DNA-specific exonuclease
MPKKKKWILKGGSDEIHSKAEDIRENFGLERPTAEILAARGYDTPEKVKAFLSGENTLMYDPFLMKDMDKAVARILSALDGGERITVYGDYDVDGVSATSVLYLYLKSAGADVDYYIPNRATEGYGMNRAALDLLKGRGTSLIVTVDTGITAVEETEYLNSIGLSLVVTDHHGCHDEIPDAVAVVNPKRPDDEYPFKELAGVGVVFKLVTALEFSIQERKIFGGDCGLARAERYARMTDCGESDFLTKVCKEYMDLVTLGTISDVMTLTDENRLICSLGLSMIERTPRLGLLALMDYSDGMKNRKYARKRKVTASYIGFTVAPRINAAGRIADASLGVELFATDDRARADEIAAELCDLNVQRQAEENRIATEAMELAEKTHDFENDPVLVLACESWHHGVIGIVSSRLTEKYNMPSILISVEDGIGKGSGRSIKGLNISNALAACSDLLIRYGGHELAAGLTVDVANIDEFRKKINDYARSEMGSEGADVTLEIDCEVDASEVNLKLAEEMSCMEPCGVGNPQPVLMLRRADVLTAESIGDGKHTKLTVGGKTALMFGMPLEEADIREGDTVDIVFKLDINEFRGMRSEQLLVCDMRLSDRSNCFQREADFLRGVENGDTFAESEGLLPDRNDFAVVYKEVRAYGEEGKTVSLYRLSKSLDGIRAAKIKLALEILGDVGLVSFEPLSTLSLTGSELYRIAAAKTTEKVNLFGTPRYKAVKNRMQRN